MDVARLRIIDFLVRSEELLRLNDDCDVDFNGVLLSLVLYVM